MILSIICLVLAIAAYSVSQLAQHAKLRGQKYDESFWGVYSDQRKYKDNNHTQGPKFFGSTTFMVFITDGYHLMQAVAMLSLSLSFGFLMGNHYYSLGAWAIIHTVHYITYKFLSK